MNPAESLWWYPVPALGGQKHTYLHVGEQAAMAHEETYREF
jgi:hypothetical protein